MSDTPPTLLPAPAGYADWLIGSVVRHLLTEVEDLREEVAKLKAKLKEHGHAD